MKNKLGIVLVGIIITLGLIFFLNHKQIEVSQDDLPQLQKNEPAVVSSSGSTSRNINNEGASNYVFPKTTITPQDDNEISVAIPSINIVEQIDPAKSYVELVRPITITNEDYVDVIQTTRGATIPLLFIVNPNIIKGLAIKDFDGSLKHVADINETGYLMHFDYHVPERAYADSWEYYYITTVPCTDTACSESTGGQLLAIQISNPLSSISQGVFTYTAHNIVGTQGFSIQYPKELAYKESYDTKYHLDTVYFFDPLDYNNDYHTAITIIYDPKQYEAEHTASEEYENLDSFEGEPEIKADGSIWQRFHVGAGNNGTPITYIKKGKLAFSISQNSWFGNGSGQIELGPWYRSLFANEDTLKFIEN